MGGVCVGVCVGVGVCACVGVTLPGDTNWATQTDYVRWAIGGVTQEEGGGGG